MVDLIQKMVKIFWIALNRNILLISSLLPLIEFCLAVKHLDRFL